MATEGLTNEANESGQSADVFIASEQEARFLTLFREADAAGKRRIRSLMGAAMRGELPSRAEIQAMGRAEVMAFADALPEFTL